MSNKYSQKFLDSTKKSITDAIKTASKRVIQKTAEATGDLISNKIAHKITSLSKSLNELHSVELRSMNAMRMKNKCQKKDIYLQKKDNELLIN